jgi:hypothetical protein
LASLEEVKKGNSFMVVLVTLNVNMFHGMNQLEKNVRNVALLSFARTRKVFQNALSVAGRKKKRAKRRISNI